MIIKNKPIHPKFKDLEKLKFNYLLVLGHAGKFGKQKRTCWWVECDCKKSPIFKVSGNALLRGNTKSCGCYNIERIKETHITHGSTKTPEYKIYLAAKDRCNNPNDQQYKNYGARGIEFRFNSFEEFIKDIGFRPSKNHSLDKINNNFHYDIGNVR